MARPTSRFILFGGENISLDASLVIYIYIYIYSTNIRPIMITNRIYEYKNILSPYRGADKSLARPTFRCTLFDGENISLDASLVIFIYIYIYSTNIPPIMITNRIYEHQNILSPYRGADKSLALPTSRCTLFDGKNISFDANIVIYIYIYI